MKQRSQVSVARPRCPYCHDEVAPSDGKAACDDCMAWHHSACWVEGGSACSACGHRVQTGAAPRAQATPGPEGTAPDELTAARVAGRVLGVAAREPVVLGKLIRRLVLEGLLSVAAAAAICALIALLIYGLSQLA